jgi:hypothetical protein
MNTRRLRTGGLLATLALATAACDMEGLTDVNVNPNNPTDAPAPNLFVNAARLGVTRWLGVANVRQFELVAQHLAEVQYPETDAYVRLTAGHTSGNFDGAYTGELKDFQQVIAKGRAQSAPGYWAPAMILRAWEFGVITDLYGDIPYSEALLGDSLGFENAIQPAYDPQQQIYNDLFARLAEASSALNTPGPLQLGAADVVYGTRAAAQRPVYWQRLSNSLRARHAMRIVNVDPTKANAELTAAFTAPGGVFTSNDHTAQFSWPGNGVYDNPWSVNFQTRDDHRISDRLMTYLLGWDDPRLPVYAMPTTADPTVYQGLPNALTHNEASQQLETTSRPGAIFYGGTTAYGTFGSAAGRAYPSYVMTNAEVQFIRAEAAERGLGGLSPAQAQGFYEAGIRASMEQWGVSSAAADAYLAQAEVAYTGTQVERLRKIAVQKWIALYSDGAQAWAEWRRTCQPAIVRPGPTATLSTVPRRLQYSVTENTVNSANVAAAVSRQGPDLLTTRIWWDTAPTAAPTHVAGCGTR